MKNDMKKKDNSMTETTETDKTENIPNKSAVDQEEPPVVHSVQTDDLKKELSQVLKYPHVFSSSKLCMSSVCNFK